MRTGMTMSRRQIIPGIATVREPPIAASFPPTVTVMLLTPDRYLAPISFTKRYGRHHDMYINLI